VLSVWPKKLTVVVAVVVVVVIVVDGGAYVDDTAVLSDVVPRHHVHAGTQRVDHSRHQQTVSSTFARRPIPDAQPSVSKTIYIRRYFTKSHKAP